MGVLNFSRFLIFAHSANLTDHWVKYCTSLKKNQVMSTLFLAGPRRFSKKAINQETHKNDGPPHNLFIRLACEHAVL